MKYELEDVKNAIGVLLREKRKSLDMTLKQLSEKTGVRSGFISTIENGKISPSIYVLLRLLTALDLKIGDFFSSLERKLVGSDTRCPGCQRPELHKMCPAYGTSYYMTGKPYTKEMEERLKAGLLDINKTE